MIRVLVADDHAVVREGIQRVLESDPLIRVVGEAGDGLEAVDACARLRPDVVVMDITMRRLNGLEATRELVRKSPETHVVILSVHSDADDVGNALEAGAVGYVVKESAGSELIAAVRRAAEGLSYFSPSVAQAAAEQAEDHGHRRRGHELLTPRERQVLGLIAEGRRGREIAETLGVSAETVKTHRRNLMAKLGLRNVAEVVRYALKTAGHPAR